MSGLVSLPWWGYVAAVLGLTHVTIAAVTIFLHRCQAHRSLTLHPVVSHFFRLWLWLTTGMVTREWAAIHRKHHAKVESVDDPHSPQVVGIHRVLWLGVLLYVQEKKNRDTIERYGHGTPDDWIERKLYSRFVFGGIVIMAAIDITVFGLIPGGIIWGVQMAWIPFWAAGVINGIGHYFGYRNFNPEDESRNIVPWGILIGGEELHNNHHAFPTSAKLSLKWYEFDIGWFYIRLLEKCGLAKVKRVAPRLVSSANLPTCDLDTLNSIIAHRFEIGTRFARTMKRSCYGELRRLAQTGAAKTVPARRVVSDWLLGMESRLTVVEKARMEAAAKSSVLLAKVAATRRELVSLWEDRDATAEQLVDRLRRFCADAEKSGVDGLRKFAAELRGFSTAPALV